MLTVIGKGGKFTGVQYPTDEQRFRDHHAALGETCIWLERTLLPISEDKNGLPAYEAPAKEELDANEVYEAKRELASIDLQSVRAIRAILVSGGAPDDLKTLRELEDRSVSMRNKLAKMK